MSTIKKYSTKLLVTGLILILLTACGADAAPEATVAATAIPPTEAVVEATQAPAEPTATSEPTAVPEPTEEPTVEADVAEPTVVPEPTDEPTVVAVEPAVNNKINLNNMTQDQLLNTIPGFSNRMVREFFEYQPYISIQQFRREIGKYVDDAQVAEYEQYVYVPVNVNESDAETLKQISGIDDTIANELMSARPYDSNEAFLMKLADYLSTEQTAVAATYLQ